MIMKNFWLLPEGVEEILPPQAGQLEDLCRRIIDLYKSWGYQLVIPPMIDFLESLLTGTGEDLELQTFKLTDQLSGRMLGIRADTTPQIARIDVHKLKRNTPTRLCYLGTVLHTRPETSGGSRTPLQVGAELYGHQGKESDAEILCLLLETLKIAEIDRVYIDLGHVGIYQGLAGQAKLNSDQEEELFNVLQRKAASELQYLARTWSLPGKITAMLEFLMVANGDGSVLNLARKKLEPANAMVKRSLQELQVVARLVKKRNPDALLNFDLAELRGYHYHTGIVFTAYVPGRGQGIAFGGRYDDIGSAFGRSRPATGFSTDVKLLLGLNTSPATQFKGIYAPEKNDPELLQQIKKLRKRGEIVICRLPGQTGNAKDMDCDRKLEKKNGKWVIVKIKNT
jgi:ATP phosphoribosyltransferase regulatory subunit